MKGIVLEEIDPVRTALYFRELQGELSAPSVKQHLAAIRMLFDWFVVEGVTGYNPASSVKGPKHTPKRGLTPILTAKETRQLFDSFDVETIKHVRDKAILGVLFYAWVRVSSCVQLNVGDYYHSGRDGFLKFKEKGGKRNTIPAHHKAAHCIDVYINRAGIDPLDKKQKKQPLFRTVYRRSGNLTDACTATTSSE